LHLKGIIWTPLYLQTTNQHEGEEVLAQSGGYSGANYLVAYLLVFIIGGTLVLWMHRNGVAPSKIVLTCFLLFVCPIASIAMAVIYTQQANNE
jgi:hypothetical protein